jgi:hypothetical protein
MFMIGAIEPPAVIGGYRRSLHTDGGSRILRTLLRSVQANLLTLCIIGRIVSID